MSKKSRAKTKTKAKAAPSLLRKLMLGAVLASSMAGGSLAALLHYYGRDLPQLISLDDYHPPQSTRVYSADGEVLRVLARERRTVVPIEKIPETVREAVLASEDADFYSHKGLDYPGMVRAFISVLRHRRFTQGASTITQQVVRTFLLSRKKTIARKIKEILLARQLEQNLSKDDILTLYLNQIYFGHGRYGVQEASRFFYGKDVDAVTLNEAAMLAGVVQSPERLSPVKHPERARKRRAYVLSQMARIGVIDASEADAAANAPLTARAHPESLDTAPHFAELIRRRLVKQIGEDLLYTGGLSVHTSLDAKLQGAAVKALGEGLRAIDKRQGYHSPLRRLKTPAKRASFLKDRSKVKLKSGGAGKGVVTAVTEDGLTLGLATGVEGFLPVKRLGRFVNSEGEHPYVVGDVIRISLRAKKKDETWILAPQMGPQAALVVLDPRNKRVVAMVGGDPFSPDAFNRATQAKRQPGSAFKPFVYGAALHSRRATPASIYPDTPEVYELTDRRWAPQNYDRKFRGPLRLRVALASSVNMVAIKLLSQLGIQTVIDFAHTVGIRSRLDPYLPLALGASVVRPIELAGAYSVFASGGLAAEPLFLVRVEGPTGSVLFEQERSPARVLDAASAFVITNLMQSVVSAGTARRARRLKRPAAGKTGTTNGHTDAWFSGFTPDLVATVWVGFDNNRSLGKKEEGSRTALPIWVNFMKAAHEGRPVRSFERPERGVVSRRIDKESGLLAPEGMPVDQILDEVFVAGTEPTEFAVLPGELTEEAFMLQQFGEAHDAPVAVPGTDGDPEDLPP